ncbi:hypothetical protein CP533_3086 [Ophiocordyceps camponoti-saundersi (nom. inval.)]|nr:hypothetical protein CP533_3086 [Ophiocordyceps camponoti-saundersi (nom. inval.)]
MTTPSRSSEKTTRPQTLINSGTRRRTLLTTVSGNDINDLAVTPAAANCLPPIWLELRFGAVEHLQPYPENCSSADASMSHSSRVPSIDDTDSFDSSTIGTLIGLAVACGALLIMACAFAYLSCRWRMKYLKNQKRTKNDIELRSQQHEDTEVLGDGEGTVATGALPAEALPQ